MEVFITPPIPTRRGLVVTEPHSDVFVEAHVGPILYEPVKSGKSDDKGEFYFPVKADHEYRVISHGAEQTVTSSHRRIFNSDFTSTFKFDDVWKTRGTTYLKDKSDYAKASSECVDLVDGRLVLRVMEGERDGTFITGHVGTGEIGEPARFAFTHGWASAKVKFHPLRGAMGGFWTQFCTGIYNEVDVVEYGGTKKAGGKDGTVHHTVWWDSTGLGSVTEASKPTTAEAVGKDFDTDACVFTVNWQADYYDFWINTRRVARITSGLSNDPHFLVASILVRNYQLDDLLANLGQINTYVDEYDWIRVWQ